MPESVTTAALFTCRTPYLEKLLQTRYPWEILPRIGDYIKEITGVVMVVYQLFYL